MDTRSYGLSRFCLMNVFSTLEMRAIRYSVSISLWREVRYPSHLTHPHTPHTLTHLTHLTHPHKPHTPHSSHPRTPHTLTHPHTPHTPHTPHSSHTLTALGEEVILSLENVEDCIKYLWGEAGSEKVRRSADRLLNMFTLDRNSSMRLILDASMALYTRVVQEVNKLVRPIRS